MDPGNERRQWEHARRLIAGYAALLTVLWIAIALVRPSWGVVAFTAPAGAALVAAGVARCHRRVAWGGTFLVAASLGVDIVTGQLALFRPFILLLPAFVVLLEWAGVLRTAPSPDPTPRNA